MAMTAAVFALKCLEQALFIIINMELLLSLVVC